jgi:hypothetical protein
VSTILSLAKRGSEAYATIQTRTIFQDCLFLALVVFASLVFYLPSLGFYGDDWNFLSLLHLSEDQSLLSLYQSLFDGDVVIRQRPVQIVYLTLFYWLFGLNPIFYHAANAIALIVSGILLYLVIRELRQDRLIALAISLVYLLLPHYSTDRFWVAAHQATFSVSFYFLSLYADLKAFRAYPQRWMGWKFLSLIGLVLSGLSYEVALPLLLLNPLLIWYGSPRTYQNNGDRYSIWRKILSLFAVNLLALMLVIGFKVLVTVRTNVETDLLTHLVYLVTGAFRVNFVTYGLGLPYILGWILFHQTNWTLVAVGVILGLFIFRYLYSIVGQPEHELFEKTKWWKLTFLGLVVFGLGYAIFVFNADLWFTSTSLGNRIAIAAAIGVAITFSGLAGWKSSLLPQRWVRTAFCIVISLLASSGFLIINTLASFWASAYQGQQHILNEIQENITALPSGSTLILDGACLERGGAYLFTGKRDLASALWIAYRDQSLNATILSNSPEVEEEGLFIQTYKSNDFYPYREELLIYNVSQKKVYTLSNVNMAKKYFENSGFVPEQDCPPGFAWGWNDP